MSEAFICDAVRTPIGRYGGLLSSVRADDLAALPLSGFAVSIPATVVNRLCGSGMDVVGMAA